MTTAQPEELGDVQWHRNLHEAQQQAAQQGRPILILFQEVPGCATCKNYGNDVLTHPLIVEAIETHFIPLAIYNNKSGADREVLEMFNEPSWNNPVVRIVDQNLNNIIPRINGNYSKKGLVDQMIVSLIKNGQSVPGYLQLLAQQFDAENNTREATYQMHCFWDGEKKLGELDGVVASWPGFQNGGEVVKVQFDPIKIDRDALDKIASDWHFKPVNNSSEMRHDNTPKYYLSNSKYKSIPMLPVQAAKVNSALGHGQDPEEFLSPRQTALLAKRSSANYVHEPFLESWQKALD